MLQLLSTFYMYVVLDGFWDAYNKSNFCYNFVQLYDHFCYVEWTSCSCYWCHDNQLNSKSSLILPVTFLDLFRVPFSYMLCEYHVMKYIAICYLLAGRVLLEKYCLEASGTGWSWNWLLFQKKIIRMGSKIRFHCDRNHWRTFFHQFEQFIFSLVRFSKFKAALENFVNKK